MRICPYCHAHGKFAFNVYARSYDSCPGCDLIYQDQEATYEAVLAPYRKEYFSSCGMDQVGGSRENLYEHILDTLEKRKGAGSLLDVGTGCGHFMRRAQQRGWQAKGIEPSTEAVFAATGKDVDIFTGTLREYPGNETFDAVTFINVLDHSAAPWDEIRRARERLKTDGMIFIRIPNGRLHCQLLRAASACGLGKKIQRYLIFHQYSLTPRFVNNLLKDLGFFNIAIFNSKPSSGDPHGLFAAPFLAQWLKILSYSAAKGVAHISQGKLFIGTSIDVIALKDKS
ncbi:MAG: class I SAM-dependent methyltransferase [Thermodesulfobacteriota bacterium]